jgi:hypothetical protein
VLASIDAHIRKEMTAVFHWRWIRDWWQRRGPLAVCRLVLRASLALALLAVPLAPCSADAGPQPAERPDGEGQPSAQRTYQQLVAEVVVRVYRPEDQQRLQSLGLDCNGPGLCQLVVPQSLLPALNLAGLDVKVSERAVVLSSAPIGSELLMATAASEHSVHAMEAHDVAIPDNAPAGWHGTEACMQLTPPAPPDGRVTRLVYSLRIQHQHVGELDAIITNGPAYRYVWQHGGGPTDGGLDSDMEDDFDITFHTRQDSITFDGWPANWTLSLCATDWHAGNTGFLDSFEVTEYYCLLPSTPWYNTPANGATDVPINTFLDWQDSTNASSYGVDFGTTNPPPIYTNVTQSHLDLPALGYGTTYYWQIRAMDMLCSSPGPVWSFTTTTGAAPTVTVWLPIVIKGD